MVVIFLRASPVQQGIIKSLTKRSYSAPHYNTNNSDKRDASAKIATSTPTVSVRPFAFLSRRKEKRCYATVLQICNSNGESHPASLLLGLSSILHPSSNLPQHPNFTKNHLFQHNTPAGLPGCQPLRCSANSVTQSAAQQTSQSASDQAASQPADYLYYNLSPHHETKDCSSFLRLFGQP